MPIGHFALGFGSTLADDIQKERDRQRLQEDQDLQMRQDLLKQLASAPNANPAMLGSIMHELMDLQSAKGGRGTKAKKGMAGFMGAHDLPMSQLLSGMMSGTTPIEGPTTFEAPVGTTGNAGYTDAKPIDLGFGTAGQDLPAAMPSIRTETRPVANQPLLESPEDMARKEGLMAGAKAEGTLSGQLTARMNAFRQMQSQGMFRGDPKLEQEWIRKNILSLTNSQENSQIHKFRSASTGQEFTLMFHPQSATYTDYSGNLTTPPTDAQIISIAPSNQINYFQDDKGNVSGVATDRYNPTNGVQAIPVPPNVQGRTSPAGPAIVDPDTHAVLRFDRNGTTARPATQAPLTGTPGAAGTGYALSGQPGQPGGALLKWNAQEQQTHDSIQQSQPMIQQVMDQLDSAGAAGESNSVGSKIHGISQRLQYGAGFDPSDPVYQKLIPLVSFLRVFLTQPYLRGMRNQTYVSQIQDHMPNLGLNPDTPALIRDKLAVIQQNMNGIMDELYGRTMTSEPAEPGIPVPPSPAVTAPAGTSKYQKRRVR